LVATLLLAPAVARAAENDDNADDAWARFRIAPTTGFLIEHRAGPTNEAALGWGFGGQARFERGIHGMALAYTGVATEMTTVGLGNGPATHHVDAAYSVLLADSRSRGDHVGVTLRFDIGPSVAFVERTLRTPPGGTVSVVDVPWHADFGGRGSFALAVHFWQVMLGLDVGYRGGFPITPGVAWEGAFFGQLALGMAVDLPNMPTR
jgi:hypothetical protein